MAKNESKIATTAEDVAELAGVSRWTVNRAFIKDASISEKSRRKVMEAATQLGYVPDLQASSLRSEKSNLISLLVDDFANPHKLIMMERLTRILRKNGWDTLLVNTLDQDDASLALLNASQRRVDAAVLIGSQFTDQILENALGAQRINKLIVFARSSNNPQTISICVDDIAATKEIATYLLGKKFKRPLFFAGPQSSSAHLLRKETFLSTWQKNSDYTPQFVSVEHYDPILAYNFISELLPRYKVQERPDIIVCENDALALGTIDAIHCQLNLKVPDDIAVTGFDDIPQANSPHYKLTTYRQPITKMAEALVAVLAGDSVVEGLDKFLGQLIIRDSA